MNVWVYILYIVDSCRRVCILCFALILLILILYSLSVLWNHQRASRVSLAWVFSIYAVTSADVETKFYVFWTIGIFNVICLKTLSNPKFNPIFSLVRKVKLFEARLLSFTKILPFNLSWIIVTTLFIWYDLHLDLLECWCWTAIRGGQPPPSHRGHLASVQGLGGGGEANRANCKGEGQGGS